MRQLTFSIERHSDRTYLLVSGEPVCAERLVRTHIQMIRAAQPQGVLVPEYEEHNRTGRLVYEITGLISFEQLYRRVEPDKREVIHQLLACLAVMENAALFMLNKNGFILNTGFMFTGGKPGSVSLLYVPIRLAEEYDAAADFGRLAEQLIGIEPPRGIAVTLAGWDTYLQEQLRSVQVESRIEPNRDQSAEGGAEELDMQKSPIELEFEEDLPMTNRVGVKADPWGSKSLRAATSVCALLWISCALFPSTQLLASCSLATVAAAGFVSFTMLSPGSKHKRKHKVAVPSTENEAAERQAAPVPAMDRTVFLNDSSAASDETVWLPIPTAKILYLLEIRCRDVDAVRKEWKGEPIRFGRGPDACCVLDNSPGISRLHAELRKEGELLLVTDLGSRNGTFVNGEKLEPHTPHRIEPGASMRMAGVEVNVLEADVG